MANSYISLLQTAWRYARSERRRFVLVYGMFVASHLVLALLPILYGWFIDSIERRPADILHNAFLYASVYMAIKLVEWSLHGPARILERQLAFNLSRNFLQERYHQALHLPVRWHQDHHSGSTINRIRKAYEALKAFFDGGFMYVYSLSKFLISLTAMIWFSPLFGTLGAALGLLTIFVIFKFDKPFIRTQEEVNEREHDISATLFDSLSNIMTVVTLRLEQSMEAGLLFKVQSVLAPFRKNALIDGWKWFAADILVACTYCVITVGYVYEHWAPGQVFYVGGLVTMIAYVHEFTSVFHDVAWQYTQIVQFNTDVQTASSIDEAYAAQHRADSASALPSDWSRIDISGLNFSHRETTSAGVRAPQNIHQLHLSLERGKRVALIGASGSGKSTLLALLRGLYEPEAGLELLIDGRPGTLATLNETVTLFPQEPEIFENTVAYNITLGLPFPEQDVQAACDQARFDEVIAQLPNGLESNIQEKGVNLSGGQKQRLALARGVLAARESKVVLLDEPTSSVDSKTEAQIYEKLFQTFRDKGMVSALHRLHLLRYFDYIYVLDRGSIVGEGTFSHLLETSPAFQELWRHQRVDGAPTST